MSIVIKRNYWRMVCGDCRLNIETVDYQYTRCPGCGSHSITSARAERWEGYAAPVSQQKDANEEIRRMLGEKVIGGNQ
jgi:DNA-directed RNA polymerase subunit RPC12/RpoP